ncbi:lactase-phlorizin hydrolase-like protein [Microthyrium microscopicum]|uniref:beta-glucosidase n=1 Tax=Microthyrium microscopicum TaxID=703497 RepID=A0A6A6UAA6_9PEZI|nr:lactase-phlorizin hydrolase-like protein [Microthyrium microscopicum]
MSHRELPEDFIWGFATAAYQIEGAIHEDGRGESQWDVFCNTPGKIADKTSGVTACDSYHQYQQDIDLLKSVGAKAYRFSISWPRIIPLGGRDDPVNEAGINWYVNFVDALLAAGIEPVATLFHWDLPAELNKRYGGPLNKDEFTADFVRYAKVMFEALGSKVKHWITFNEPWCTSILGYHCGIHAPGRCSDRNWSPEGNSATEPWIVGHSLLVAHAHTVKLYREEMKPKFGGKIGITLNGDWVEPWDAKDPADVEACQRKLEFSIAWFGDPVYFGDYPASIRKQIGDRLPEFTEEESALIKGSNDFYGMNHYCANYIRHKDQEVADEDDIAGNLELLFENKAGESIGPETQSAWLRPYAIGFRKLLVWISKRYDHPTILVTENGTSLKAENDLPVDELLQDDFRAWYFQEYIGAMVDARCLDGVNVIGYLAWSLLDNFEWAEGYETRFGVTYVDYEHGQTRHPKKSAKVIGQLFTELTNKA